VSIININTMTSSNLVSQYVVELFGAGHFLSRDDHARLDQWLALSGSADELLLVLDEVLPSRLQKSREQGKKVFSLSSVKKSVEKRIQDRRALVGSNSHG
jgi:hypothetical protein